MVKHLAVHMQEIICNPVLVYWGEFDDSTAAVLKCSKIQIRDIFQKMHRF